jgi:alpha-D-ribose 1-methylphosphonate 5-triphosphate diphosphatase
MNSHILTNARIITPAENFEGSLIVENGIITDIQKQKKYQEGIDLKGQWLIPGIIDIHSDYLEKEIHPRPSATFPIPFAMHFMDARAAACGITTLFSAVSFSQDTMKSRTFDEAIELTKAIDSTTDNLLIRHYIHARLDPNTHDVLDYLDEMRSLKNLKLVVFNENIPGQRQFPLERIIDMRSKSLGISKEEAHKMILDFVKEKSEINYRFNIQQVFKKSVPIGSHDDTTIEHVLEAKTFGATLSEMPTTIEAARKAKEIGMFVCMGAPNYCMGGSHCGNLSSIDAMNENLVDIFCSDYHFPTMLGSLVKMINSGLNPSYATNLITKNAADYLEMPHIGSIEKGKVADLISFDVQNDYGVVTNVLVDGRLKYSTNYVTANKMARELA